MGEGELKEVMGVKRSQGESRGAKGSQGEPRGFNCTIERSKAEDY